MKTVLLDWLSINELVLTELVLINYKYHYVLIIIFSYI